MSSKRDKSYDSRRDFIRSSAMMAASAVLGGGMARADEPQLAPPDKQPPLVKIPEPPAKTVGYAVVGLGQLALEEVMPGFAEAKISRPVALVSGHPEKAKKVAATYHIDPKNIYSYDTFEKLADNPAVDVIYVILPNSMHAEFTIRGLKAGKHVLCEKPMATSAAECMQMIEASKAAQRKLMIAYRLRHEPFNMTAIDICRKGEIGQLKTITASNCQDTPAPNIRLSKALGGGPVQDVGIYCINAFRYLSGEEPVEVSAFSCQPKDVARFREVPESVTFSLRFPSGLITNGDCSFGTSESRSFCVHGATGALKMDRAFGYKGQRLTLDKDKKTAEFAITPVDHFAAEMDYYSECILSDKLPRTPGEEGLADIKIIAAIEESIRTGQSVKL